MGRELDLIEKINIEDNIKEPFAIYFHGTLEEKKRVARSVLQRDNDAIILISSGGFSFDSIFSGLTEKHIEHIAKNAPKNYKDNILKLIHDQEAINDVFEIAKAMDEDSGRGSTQNQKRVRNVIQYIKDNRMVFEF